MIGVAYPTEMNKPMAMADVSGAPIRKLVEWEPLEHSVPSVIPCWGSELPIADVQEEPEEGEAIVV